MDSNPLWQLLIAIGATTVVVLPSGALGVSPEGLYNTAVLVFVGLMASTSVSLATAERYVVHLLLSLLAVVLYLGFVGLIVEITVALFSLDGSREGAMVFLVVVFYPLALLASSLTRLFRRRGPG